MSASIILQGLGSHVPAKRLTNDDLAHLVETSDEWIRTRSGIRERRIAGPDENPSDLAVPAAHKALAQAGLTPAEVDLLIVGTMTPDLMFPSTACLLQHKLGLRPVPGLRRGGGVLRLFVYFGNWRGHGARGAVSQRAHRRRGKNVGGARLAGSFDLCSVWRRRGRGRAHAPARSRASACWAAFCTPDGGQVRLLLQPGGGSACPPTTRVIEERKHFLKMNGKEVFKIAVREMEQVIRDLLEQHQLIATQIALRRAASGQHPHPRRPRDTP